jgi:hypothetical protein
LRADNEAAERRKQDEDVDEVEDEEDGDEEDDDEEAEASDADADEEGEEGEDDEEPKPKKKPKAPAKPKVTKARTRTPKVTRMKVVWSVFNNSHQVIEEFDYPHKKEAEELVAKLTADKKSGHPFFLQPVKKPMEK